MIEVLNRTQSMDSSSGIRDKRAANKLGGKAGEAVYNTGVCGSTCGQFYKDFQQITSKSLEQFNLMTNRSIFMLGRLFNQSNDNVMRASESMRRNNDFVNRSNGYIGSSVAYIRSLNRDVEFQIKSFNDSKNAALEKIQDHESRSAQLLDKSRGDMNLYIEKMESITNVASSRLLIGSLLTTVNIGVFVFQTLLNCYYKVRIERALADFKEFHKLVQSGN